MLSTITITNKRSQDEIEITENGKTSYIKRNLDNDYAAQRNFALEKAKGDWILFLDTDERLEHELTEIPIGFDAFYLRRLDEFFGKTLKHGETGNIRLIRLAKKNFGTWTGKVHETWVGSGKIGTLKNPILHFPHQTIKEFIREINNYTEIRANEVKKSNFLEILKPIFKFIDNYVLKLGFLDGFAGFVMAYMMSLHSLIVRVKQYEKQNN